MRLDFIEALAGGALIGLSAALLLFANGRIAGISGILGGALTSHAPGFAWRWAFLLGLVATGSLSWWLPERFDMTGLPSLPLTALAGLVVGFGSRLGSGCTSGHGVCGIGRGSPRSVVATLTFMLTAALTVFVRRHVW